MRAIFADTSYWIALLNPRDHLHRKAKKFSESLGSRRVVTSEMVLVEFLNDSSQRGRAVREAAVSLVRHLRQVIDVFIVPQSSLQFEEGLTLFGKRKDKEWALTDCASFLIMEGERLTQALTHDHHFQQAGFRALLRD